ncbi:MAG: hypothetical protein JWQ96_771 [Segetibacter sp.]|nr:hypothetical protein [Segetibacter sp.]
MHIFKDATFDHQSNFMKKTVLLLFLLSFLQKSYSQVFINNIGTGYSQDFNSLASTGTTDFMPQGWLLYETGNGANTTYTADNGGVISGNTYSYGATSSTERAFGTLLSGSVSPIIGVAFTNNSNSTITAFTVSYTGEQWRLGATSRLDRLDFQYSFDATSLSTGSWTDADNLDFVAPVTTGSVGPLNGNDAANQTLKTGSISGVSIAPGTTFYLRWVDFNPAGSDDGLAVDNFSITFNGTALPPCAAPTTQPTFLTFNNITNTSINGDFTAADPAGDQYLVIISTSNTLSATPQNGTSYAEGDALGNGTVVGTSSSTAFSASSLSPGTTYYFYVFALNSACTGGPVYNTSSPLTGNVATTTPAACATPTGTPGAITFTPSGTSISGSFGAATGANSYLVIRSTNATIDFTPANGTSYPVGQTVGSPNTGTVIKFGEGTTFSTTGLATNTNYYFFVFAVSNVNCTGGPLYNTTATTGNTTTTSSSSSAPATYYSTATSLGCSVLKDTLKAIITRGNTPKTYTDLWGQYQVSDIKPREVGPGTSPTVIWDVYSDNVSGPDPYNFTPGPVTSGGQQDNGSSASAEGQYYNREHSVPLSWFNGNTGTPGPATDYLHIFPTDKIVNAIRSNYIYGEVATASYTSANGSKLGSSAIAGFTGDVFEPVNAYKGDLARAFLYFVTRYQDNMPGWPGGNGAQAFDPTTYPSVDIPYLELMIKWHTQDPVSQKEIDRNNAAYSFQGNRNPYIDSPQYVNLVWNNTCTGLAALPVHIVYFAGKLVGSNVNLEWKAENETYFDRFEIERSINGTDFKKVGEVKAANRGNYNYSEDVEAFRSQRLYYRLKSVDKDGKFKYSAVFSVHIPFNTKFTVYPNPASSFIQLQLNKNITGNVTIQVTDALGKVVKQVNENVSGSNIRISTSSLATGTYIIKMLYKGEQYNQKVMVIK